MTFVVHGPDSPVTKAIAEAFAKAAQNAAPHQPPSPPTDGPKGQDGQDRDSLPSLPDRLADEGGRA